jgi:TRAP-type C4-dicarboxylate transport system substrate-binding protein
MTRLEFRAGIVALAATACLAGGLPARAQSFTMKLSSPTVNDLSFEWMKAFKEGVEARSGGRIKVELYPGGQLGSIPRTVEGVALGTIEFVIPASGFLAGLEPRFITFDTVGLFDSAPHALRVFHDPEIRTRLATFGAAKGVEPLAVFVHSPLALLSHKPVRSLADFKGQKIRVPGGAPLHIEPFKHLGASPLSIPLGEVLPAMQNHTIDGMIAGSTVYTSFKYYDVAKGLTYLPRAFIVTGGVVNRAFMKSLGPELEAVVREEARKADELSATWGVQDVERARKTWVEHGGENIELSPEEGRRFEEEVRTVSIKILSDNPQIRADYEAIVATAKKYR